MVTLPLGRKVIKCFTFDWFFIIPEEEYVFGIYNIWHKGTKHPSGGCKSYILECFTSYKPVFFSLFPLDDCISNPQNIDSIWSFDINCFYESQNLLISIPLYKLYYSLLLPLLVLACSIGIPLQFFSGKIYIFHTPALRRVLEQVLYRNV